MGLFGPVWKGSDVKGDKLFKAQALIYDMDDRDKAKVAAETGTVEVAKYAMKDLKDPELFYEIARDGQSLYVRLQAVEKLRSQEMMGKLACLPKEKGKSEASRKRELENYQVRMLATKKLHIQDVLRKIAFDTEYCSDQRKEAMTNFTSPEDLERFAREEVESSGRLYAWERIKDEDLRKEIEASWSEEQRSKDRAYLAQKHLVEKRIEDAERRYRRKSEGRCLKCGEKLDGRSEFAGKCRFCGALIKM